MLAALEDGQDRGSRARAAAAFAALVGSWRCQEPPFVSRGRRIDRLDFVDTRGRLHGQATPPLSDRGCRGPTGLYRTTGGAGARIVDLQATHTPTRTPPASVETATPGDRADISWGGMRRPGPVSDENWTDFFSPPFFFFFLPPPAPFRVARLINEQSGLRGRQLPRGDRRHFRRTGKGRMRGQPISC